MGPLVWVIFVSFSNNCHSFRFFLFPFSIHFQNIRFKILKNSCPAIVASLKRFSTKIQTKITFISNYSFKIQFFRPLQTWFDFYSRICSSQFTSQKQTTNMTSFSNSFVKTLHSQNKMKMDLKNASKHSWLLNYHKKVVREMIK